MNFENKTLGSFSSTRNEMILNFGIFELLLKSLVKDLMSNYISTEGGGVISFTEHTKF